MDAESRAVALSTAASPEKVPTPERAFYASQIGHLHVRKLKTAVRSVCMVRANTHNEPRCHLSCSTRSVTLEV